MFADTGPEAGLEPIGIGAPGGEILDLTGETAQFVALAGAGTCAGGVDTGGGENAGLGTIGVRTEGGELAGLPETLAVETAESLEAVAEGVDE